MEQAIANIHDDSGDRTAKRKAGLLAETGRIQTD